MSEQTGVLCVECSERGCDGAQEGLSEGMHGDGICEVCEALHGLCETAHERPV